MNTEQERAEFEAFASKHGLCVTEDGDLYRSHVVAWMWKAWQARAALQSKDREDTTDPLQGAADWLVEAIEDCEPSDLQNQLLIGFNRAKRLFDHARRIEGDGQ